MTSRLLRTLAFALAVTVAVPALATTDMVGWYFPLTLGASWTYTNVDDPGDIWANTVLDEFTYEGQPAFRFGEDVDNCTIVYRAGGVVTVYAEVENGVLHDLTQNVVLDDVLDGEKFAVCFQAPCDTSMIRVWQNIDPVLREPYDIDPALDDMIVIASYDPAYGPNLHNVVMASNLPAGATPPPGAVTSMEWYLRGSGMVIEADIDAESGGFVDVYVLTDAVPVPETVSPAGVTLAPAAPNPFNPRTTLGYHLERPSVVDLVIFDCAGHRVRTLATGAITEAGDHGVVWDGVDDRGQAVPSGTYLGRLATGDVVRTQRMVLVR